MNLCDLVCVGEDSSTLTLDEHPRHKTAYGPEVPTPDSSPVSASELDLAGRLSCATFSQEFGETKFIAVQCCLVDYG